MDEQLELEDVNARTPDGHEYRLSYEKGGDVVEIVFPGVRADCAVELTDHILLRFNREQRQAAGLTILGFSVLVTPTELGPRSFAMTGLGALPEMLHEVVASILSHAPVNHFLRVTSYQMSPTETIPLTFLEGPGVLPLAS